VSDFLYRSILIGIGATALLDLWVLGLHLVVGTPGANWRPVGRWFCHVAQGNVFHEEISQARPFPFELAVGWIGHYIVGIVFAAVLVAIAPSGWVTQPTLAPAMIVGIVTIGAGWFILQPAMGAGIAASKRPNANQIRAMSIAGHIVFGLGLYLTAILIQNSGL
jgi:hypothetical protein